jgi:uncharacterized membrane protein
MLSNGFVDSMPFWILSIITLLLVFLSIEIGWRMGHFYQDRHKKEKNLSIGIAEAATLGLLSFLLAFVFGMAATRYDTRKGFIVTQANSIGTTYLRTNFLTEPARSEAQKLLRQYLSIQSGGAASILSTEGIAKSSAILDRLWEIGSDAVEQKDTVSIGLFIQSLNDTIDVDTYRVTANRNRLPDSIWLMLAIVTVIGMISLGFEFGLSGNRRWIGTILLVIAFASVILLISDLDRPQEGLIQISQKPLLDLLVNIGGPTP